MSSEKQNGVHPDENINTENGGKNDNEINMAEDSKNLLGIPRQGHRLSFMEEESLKERNRLNLLKQISAILKQGDQKYNKESLHRTFQDEDLLDRIFRLFTNDHLVQEDWFEFLKARLQEDKQLDFVEQVESVAYVLCGDGDINRESFCKILRNKVVTNKLVRALDAGSGCVSAEDLMELITAASASRTRAGIDKESLDRLEQLFKDTVGDQKEITREQFQKIVVSKNPFFTDRVFQIFDEDDSGAISQREFLDAAARVASRAPDDKLRFLFKVYDLDGDGLIQHRELEHVMRAAMEENNMDFSEQQLRELTTALFEDADVESRGAITCDALREQLARHGGLLDNLSISIDRWLVPPPQPPPLTLRQRLIKMKPYQLSLNYVKNNYAFVTYLVLFFLVNLGLFVSRLVEYRDHNGFVMFARASGQCLNFSSSWVLVLMLRRSLTALRDHGLSALLDRHVSLHKLTALVLLAHAALHTAMHLCNFSVVVVHESPHYQLYEWLLTSRPGLFGLVPGWANPTGIILTLVLGALAYSSRPAVRRRGCFEVFYFAHLLYIPFWILLILHAPNFWKWFIVPGTIYVIEKMLRLWWLRSGRGRSYICSGALLPSRVLHVAARRPRALRFRAGDYVFVNVPAVAAYEWHPFTITSAPDEDDYIWLHIRAVGEWTNRLYEYFEQQTKNEQQLKTKRSNSTQSNKSKRSSKKPSIDSGYTNEAFTVGDENEDSTDVVSPSRSPSPCASPRPCPAGALSLADSFRHLRTRPAIVTCDAPPPPSERDSILAAARRRLSKTLSLNRIEQPVKIPDPDPEAPQEPQKHNSTDEENPEGYSVGKPLELFVDGPYGAASSLMFSSQHAVLVAAGIGVTPFASVLRALVRTRDAATCDECGLRKVDFIWINREPRSFEWFVSLLSRLELQQAARVSAGAKRFLDMHMYVTSALQRADMKAVGLQLALDLLHRKEQRDLITGLKTRTNAGRPNWDKVFARLSAAGEGRVSVFYCGPPRLGRLLRDKCCQFGFEFRKEVF